MRAAPGGAGRACGTRAPLTGLFLRFEAAAFGPPALFLRVAALLELGFGTRDRLFGGAPGALGLAPGRFILSALEQSAGGTEQVLTRRAENDDAQTACPRAGVTHRS